MRCLSVFPIVISLPKVLRFGAVDTRDGAPLPLPLPLPMPPPVPTAEPFRGSTEELSTRPLPIPAPAALTASISKTRALIVGLRSSKDLRMGWV